MRQPIVFGKYLLLERISVGGMAEVFKAKFFGEQGFEKILAIKRILPSMAEDQQFIEMFIDEAKIAGELSHPNVGQVYELGEIDGAHFIAMEYIWGKDVLQIQNRFRRYRQKMPPGMAAYVASRVCEGLDYAHRREDADGGVMGIVHRDVSPQNILCAYSGEVKIIDFGIAKARSRSSKTQAGVLKGKFGYMSPEQVRGFPLDQRSDIFSIGTLLWEMVTGERLFVGETDFATLDKVRNARAPVPSSVNPAVPPELDAVVMRALSREPDDRYQWASEMQEELSAFLDAQDPPFTKKVLGVTVTRLFEVERQREMARLTEYQSIGKGDMQRMAGPQQPAEAQGDLVMSLVPLDSMQPGELLPDSAFSEVTEEEFEEDDATTVGGPAFDQAAAVGDSQGLYDPEAVALLSVPQDDGGEFEEDDETFVYQGGVGPEGMFPGVDGGQGAAGGGGGPEELTSEPTYIFSAESGQVVPASAQSAQLYGPQGGGHQAVHFPDDNAPQGPTMLFDVGQGSQPYGGNGPAAAAAMPMGPVGAAVPPPADQISGTMPVNIEPQRSSLVKDILIGVLVALVVIMGVVVWRVMSTAGTGGAKSATLVVSTTPPVAAEVLVDGASKGQMQAGVPFKLKGVSADEHVLTVRAAGMVPAQQKVSLEAGDVKVVTLALEAAPTTGSLTLKVQPEGAKLTVDGKAVASYGAGKPLVLAAGRSHKLVVEKDGYAGTELTLSVKAGEAITREVNLQKKEVEAAAAAGQAGAAEVPAAKVATLEVSTTPAGASVWVDGKAVGDTPVTVKDLAPGRHEVKASKLGYVDQASKVELKAGEAGKVTLALKEEPPARPTAVAAASPKPAAAKPAPEPRPRPAAARPRPEPRPKPVARPRTEDKPKGPRVIRTAAADKPKRDNGGKPDKPKPAAAAGGGGGGGGGKGFLMANTMPWGAKVLVNGKDTGKVTPVAMRNKIPLRAGNYKVTFVLEGKKHTFPVTIAPGETARLIKKLK